MTTKQLVRLEDMTDEEISEQIAELNARAARYFEHADELQRYHDSRAQAEQRRR